MTDSAFGFRPVKGHQGCIEECVIPASDGTATFVGDAVVIAGAEDTTDNAITVVQAQGSEGTPSAAIFGVIVGFIPDFSDLTSKYRLASTKRRCLVCKALPSVEFEVQCDGAIAAGDTGAYYDMIVGSGSTTTGRSAMEVDISSTSATDGQLQLLRPSRITGDTFDTAAAGTNVIVAFNESAWKLYGTTAASGAV